MFEKIKITLMFNQVMKNGQCSVPEICFLILTRVWVVTSHLYTLRTQRYAS